MAVEVLTKSKGTRTCGDCGGNMAAGQTKCQNCGSTNIKKSLVIVRKAVGDDDDDLENVVETDEVEDEDEEDEDEETEENEDEEDDEDDDDEDEDDDDDEEEEESPAPLTKVGKRVMAVEALNLTTALAEGIVKCFTGDVTKIDDNYETLMTDFNTVVDAATSEWRSGDTISKSSSSKQQIALIRKRIEKIVKEGGAMPTKDTKKVERPKAFDDLELPDDVKAYIEGLEGVQKSSSDDDEEEDIYKGLTPAAAAIVKKAAETNERDTQSSYLKIAKGYQYLPGDKEELAKSLREAEENSPAAYKTLKATLDAANELAKDSSVFKSFGSPREGGDESSEIAKRAKELVEKGDFKTLEQAEVSLMSGKDYTPSNPVSA